MKYYYIASTIEIKTAVLSCREINTKNYAIFVPFLPILSHFRLFFLLVFKVILLIIFTIFLGHQNPGPGYYIIRISDFCNLFRHQGTMSPPFIFL